MHACISVTHTSLACLFNHDLDLKSLNPLHLHYDTRRRGGAGASMAATKTVLMLCGDFMEDYEVMVPFQALQAYGVSVDAVCPGKKAGDVCPTCAHQPSTKYQTFTETRGHNFTLNATFDEIDVSKYNGLLIPGGRSPEYLAMNQSILDIVSKFNHTGKPIAFICHAPLILAAADLVRGRTCTGFPSIKAPLVQAGCHWVEPDETLSICVVDGNFISAPAYHGHPEFIRRFVEKLGGTITGSDKKIVFICGDFTEGYEVMVPFQSLQALGCSVDAICPKKHKGDKCATDILEFEGDKIYSEKIGYDFTITRCFECVNASNYDGLVVPGGRALEYLCLDNGVTALVSEFMKAGKPVASIGRGPQILGAADVLQGRKCTAYPTLKLNVVLAGATWLEPDPIDRCFTDGNLVTGASWHGHPEFISQFMALLGIKVSF